MRERVFKCECGLETDRDSNAAIKIHKGGIPSFAGGDVRRALAQYRLRQKNSANNYDPPEEFIYNAEFGIAPVDKFLLALKLEGIYSSGPRITYLAPTLFVTPVPNVSLEASLRMPFGGRDFFAGRIYGVGLYFQR